MIALQTFMFTHSRNSIQLPVPMYQMEFTFRVDKACRKERRSGFKETAQCARGEHPVCVKRESKVPDGAKQVDARDQKEDGRECSQVDPERVVEEGEQHLGMTVLCLDFCEIQRLAPTRDTVPESRC